MFVGDAVADVTSDRAFLQAMLDFEAALAASQARVGVIPAAAAETIGAACSADGFDITALGRAARGSATPVVPLLEELRARIPGEAACHAHYGATSQDVIDTALSLVSRAALDVIVTDLEMVADHCARLADHHRATPMIARTLLQQALPTTFGLRAAGWLGGALEARRELVDRRAALAVQLGGPAGTLSALGDAAPAVLAELADTLSLVEPALPWHAARGRAAGLGAGLGIAAGTLAKIALDVVLLSQTEIGEVAEASGGGSSSMGHKRNPAGSVRVLAAERRVRANVGVLIGSMAQEHERAAGAWQAEWDSLRDALALTGGAAATTAEVLSGLRVDAERMRANLDDSGAVDPAASASADVFVDRALALRDRELAGR
ncbi:MAG: 3-carboxy-cis,cis-muconate cycloisomerase [Actinomycetota bacterium]